MEHLQPYSAQNKLCSNLYFWLTCICVQLYGGLQINKCWEASVVIMKYNARGNNETKGTDIFKILCRHSAVIPTVPLKSFESCQGKKVAYW